MQIRVPIKTPRVFQPLDRPARYKGAFGGRGSGKSHYFATRAVLLSMPERKRILCVREYQRSLRESAKRLIEDKIEVMGVGSLFQVLSTEIRTPHGGVMSFVGMQDHTAESIKSYEGYDIAWIEEGQTLSERSLELLRPTIRAPGSEIWASWNPRSASDPIDALLRGPEPPTGAIVVRANYMDNPYFPADLEDERTFDETHNRTRYGHIWLGEYEPMAIGAIWDRLTLHQGRRADAPDMGRIVVAVDPAISSLAGADEHGIVVCGHGGDDRGYVLEDATCRGTPQQWGTRVVAMYDKWQADAVVIERNQGGDMVRHVLDTIRPGLPVIEVTATRGKHVRAEPIASLYTLGRVSHVGTFSKLEDQLCLMTASGYEGEGSPDRADALIWGMTELFPSIVRGTADEPDERGTRRPSPTGWLGA